MRIKFPLENEKIKHVSTGVKDFWEIIFYILVFEDQLVIRFNLERRGSIELDEQILGLSHYTPQTKM